MGELFVRVMALERMVAVLWARVTALETRITALQQQATNQWYGG